LSLRLPLLRTRWFNPDEFEHLHAARCKSHGLVPYHDFFEHHTPWLYYLLSPLVKGAEQGPEAASRAILEARGLCLALTAAALAAVVWVGRSWGTAPAGWLRSAGSEREGASGSRSRTTLAELIAALLLAGMPTFLDKSLEIRPDVSAMFLWVCCLGFLASAIRSSTGVETAEYLARHSRNQGI